MIWNSDSLWHVQYGYNPDRMFQVKSYALQTSGRIPKTTAGKMIPLNVASFAKIIYPTNSVIFKWVYFVRQTQIAKQIK
jgi:hypothetical protein